MLVAFSTEMARLVKRYIDRKRIPLTYFEMGGVFAMTMQIMWERDAQKHKAKAREIKRRQAAKAATHNGKGW